MIARLHLRSLIANTTGFGIAFALWVLFGPIVRELVAEFDLSPTQGAVLKALPIFTGSVLRVPVGILTDRLGARRTFTGLLVFGAVAAALIPFANGFWTLAAGGLALGLVGAPVVVFRVIV